MEGRRKTSKDFVYRIKSTQDESGFDSTIPIVLQISTGRFSLEVISFQRFDHPRSSSGKL
jgi:hypothetical protein